MPLSHDVLAPELPPELVEDDLGQMIADLDMFDEEVSFTSANDLSLELTDDLPGDVLWEDDEYYYVGEA